MLDFYKKVFEDLKSKKITKEQAAERLKAKANLAGEDEDFRAYSKELVSQRRSEKEVINLPQPEYTFAGKGSRENKPNIELTSLIGSGSKSNGNACRYSLIDVQKILTETLSQSLYMDASEIHIDRKFIDLGLDSIIGVEWIEKLKKSLPLNIKVTKIYDFPTIRDLASNLHSELLLAESSLEVTPEKLISTPSNDLTVSAQSLLENEEQSLSKELIHHTNSDVRKEQRKYVATILSNTLAKALFMDVNEITPKKTFTDLGLDSIIGVEWVNTVNKNFHVNIKVTTIYDYPNVEALSGYIDGMLLSRTMELPGAREDESPEILSALGRIEGERANSRDDRPASNNITERELASVSTSVSVEFNKAYHLGAEGFRQRYGCSMSYFSGSMYRAIASEELVLSMANAEILSFFGSAGFKAQELNQKILSLKLKLQNKKTYGMCLIHQMDDPDEELKHVNLFIEHQIPVIEVAAFFNLTPALVYCRVKGLKEINGKIIFPRRIIAKCSRIEVATLFMSPPSEDMLVDLLAFGMITEEEARLAAKIPMADDLAIECDSGGHTDHGIAQALIPSVVALRDTLVYQYVYQDYIYIGCGGGLGTPQAIASAFILGADFVFTGSINQCTVESGASDAVKDILTRLTVHDTTMAPAGDMFEIGAKVQVVNKYSQFAKRANHLYRLYQQYASLDDIPHQIRIDIEKYYFNRSIDDVWKLVCEYKKHHKSEQLDDARGNPKLKMKLVFQWYYAYTNSITANGDQAQRDNFQIHCGPAMGAFNLWVRGTQLEVWQNRRVVDIAHMLMREAGVYLASSKEKYSSSFSREPYSNDIAIIGMAGQFPCSNNLQEFWLNLVSGNDCIREVPADRWNLELFYSQDRGAEGKSYCRWLGAIDSAPNFDPLFFQISPVEARLMDPQQRVFFAECMALF